MQLYATLAVQYTFDSHTQHTHTLFVHCPVNKCSFCSSSMCAHTITCIYVQEKASFCLLFQSHFNIPRKKVETPAVRN